MPGYAVRVCSRHFGGPACAADGPREAVRREACGLHSHFCRTITAIGRRCGWHTGDCFSASGSTAVLQACARNLQAAGDAFYQLRQRQTDGCWRMQAAIFVVIVDAAAGFVALPLPSARPVGAQGMQMAAGCATDAALSRRMVLRSAAAALVLGEHGGGRGWLRRRAYLCESPATCPMLQSSETLLDVFCALRRRRRAKGACGREGRG